MLEFKNIQKPQRYIGNEWNVIKKPHANRIRICLGYPDLYEVGMSNLGIRIIYSLLNEYTDVVCERVFMPGLDLMHLLRQKKLKLFSIETKTALDAFEVIGFHLGYELTITNMLAMLELGGVPLRACERKRHIVIAGGAINPEPFADFVDTFFLGEFEESADIFVDVLRRYKDKEERLKALSEKNGFYVPCFYRIQDEVYGSEHLIKTYAHAQLPLRRVIVKNLDCAHYPVRWLTPHTQIVHDRVQIEIARGCPHRCKFCQARAVYFPYRERKPKVVERLIQNIYAHSGYENLSLLSLSASDYSCLEELIDSMYNYLRERSIGLSLPSLRLDDSLGGIYKKLVALKKTSLTIALEVTSDSLRQKLGKHIDVHKLFEVAELLRTLKIRLLKIYFMFGFSDEDEGDLLSIGQFLQRLSASSKLALNVSINIFVPKPFSFWEAVSIEEEKILKVKKAIILKGIPKNRNITISISSVKKSILEAVISRADRNFSKVIHRAYALGAVFDGYPEYFSWDIWRSAMKQEKIDYKKYLYQNSSHLPWSFIEGPSCSP